ncbi:G patch domain-containing protein 4 [Linnemannia schmuckeri]|uniref:G patch domain-containing protein 4 n=1 Tax=Linnemannia schmuckeri TaxID=64567 RepID=A0A9P5VA03_9FUNG|nr:G patch domain-containing protein 4 [Linnemannia schmuckeri]
MSFAEKQLAKFGWKSGDGLGKNKDGIKKSISVTKKNDTKGLGGKLDKWDFAWWDHVFNKSAANIQVNKDESGEVKVEKQASSDIQTSRMGIISTSRPAGPSRSTAAASSSTNTSGTSTPTTMGSMTPRDDYAVDGDDVEPKTAAPAKSGPSWLFGFVKASASSAATEEAKRTNKDFTTSASSFAARAEGYDELKAAEGDAYRDYSVKISDKELFEACEGRTARKGARSEQPGKLGRVTTELLIDDGVEKPKKNTAIAAKEKKEKKGKKDKKDKKDKKEKKSKAEKKQPKEKKQPRETKDKKEKSESKEKKEKKVMKEKKDKEEKKSKKRSADEDEPRPSKKSKKEKTT